MLLKQASDDRSFADTVGHLYLCVNKKNQISTLSFDRFYLLANFSGIVFDTLILFHEFYCSAPAA